MEYGAGLTACCGLILLGASLLFVRGGLYPFDRDRPEDEIHLLLSILGRMGVWCGLAGAAALLLSVAGVLMAVALIAALPIIFVRYRASQRLALLTLLGAATRRGLPLAPVLRAFSQEWRGKFSRRSLRAAAALDAGASLPDVLASGRLLPREALAQLEVGQEVGALNEALVGVANRAQTRDPRLGIAAVVSGGLSLALLNLVVIAFMLQNIVPSQVKIFNDFDLPTPLIARTADSIGQWINANLPTIYDGVYLLFIHTLAWMRSFEALIPLTLMAALLIYAVIHGWDSLLPLAARTRRRLDGAWVLRGVALAAAAGRPPEVAIGILAKRMPRRPTRRRLRAVLRSVERGEDAFKSLVKQRFVTGGELTLLQASIRADNLAWAAREAAEGAERRLDYRLAAVARLLAIGSVTFFGAIALFLAVGVITTISALVLALA